MFKKVSKKESERKMFSRKGRKKFVGIIRFSIRKIPSNPVGSKLLERDRLYYPVNIDPHAPSFPLRWK